MSAGSRKSPEELRVESLYFNLDQYTEVVEDSIPFIRDVNSLACLTVLEEDLHSLLGECEELLVGEAEVSDKMVNSLECRTFTVIEELKRLTRS